MDEINGIYKWKYHTEKTSENVYEDISSLLKKYTQKEYLALEKAEREQYIQEVIKEIRKINVFPIIYYNHDGIKEEIKKVIEKNDVTFVDDSLYTRATQGSLLLNFLFPNLELAECFKLSNNNMYTRFYDDNILATILDKNFSCDTPSGNLPAIYFKYSRFYWPTPINFSAIRAKAIFEKFCPQDGVIYDYSAGYGGRMLGALSSNKNFTYIATEPNKNTCYNLNQLGRYIEEVTNRTNSYKIYDLGSECINLPKNSIDFCFSCPPFFKKEIYSDEDTQSTAIFPTYEEWKEGYVRKTIQNCYNSLKIDGVYGVDIMNYNYHGRVIPLINDWLQIAKEEGFYFHKSLVISSRTRNRDGESIYLFTKDETIPLPDYAPEGTNYLKQMTINKEKYQRRKHFIIVSYDINGKYLNNYSNYDEIENYEEIKPFINKNEPYKNIYYRIYRGNETVPVEITVKKPIVKIDDQYFFSQSDLARYLNISRQAVSQAKMKQSNKILNHDIEWLK